MVHIDFGFLLTDAPGRGLKFETAPFKLKTDYVRVLGGLTGSGFKRYRKNMTDGFMELNKNAAKLILLVQMVANSQSDLSCFKEGTQEAVNQLKERLMPNNNAKLSKKDCADHIDELIGLSNENWRTKLYDGFQFCVQGIY